MLFSNIATFDAHDFTDGSHGQKVVLKMQLKSGAFQKIYEFEIDGVGIDDFYLPVFKIGDPQLREELCP